MKHILKYSLGCLIWIVSSMVIVSCSDDDSSDLYSAIYPKSVELIIPEELQPLIYNDTETNTKVLPLIKGENVTLDYFIAPDDITFEEVSWSSSNTNVASIDNSGKVIAISGDGAGYTIIQVAPAVFYAGSNIFSTLKITVDNTLISAESIIINSESNEVFAGETIQLSATILPADASYKTVRWTSSNESVATVNKDGLVTGIVNSAISANVTITATSLDGAQTIATKEITVKQIVQPLEVEIDQTYSVDNNYLCAIADKSLTLTYTTVPAECTKSLIQWTSSDNNIATVEGGVVTFNQGTKDVLPNFGDITITATCPETGNTSSIKLHLAEGLMRELFHNQNNYTWYNAAQSGNGTSSSHIWSYGKITVTTYKQNDTNQRADLKCWSPITYLHAGNYPILAIRIDDAMDLYEGVTMRNITLDASGNAGGVAYSGGLDGNNNKWLNDYKCSDGSHVFIYNLSTQKWANGGALPTNALAAFPTFQFKYADIRTLTKQVTYNVYWVQTFKTIDDVKAYIASEGLTYEIIK